MSLYEVLKASKTERFPDYWTLLWGRKMSASMIKTITGVLPLSFTAKGGNAVDWTIYGNDDAGTESLFNIPDNTSTGYNNYYASAVISAGTMAEIVGFFNQHIGENFAWYFDVQTEYSGNIYSSVVFYYTDSTFRTFITNRTLTVEKTIDKIEIRANYSNAEGAGLQYTFKNITIVKGSTAPDHYIPYQQGVGEQRQDGYYVPLTISQTGKPDKTYDIYIGDSPLTEGQQVSKTSTGQDIELFNGENVVSTTLYNKPAMEIKYK